MGLVYRAHDTRLDRRVALKVVALDRADEADRSVLRARLLREARAAAKLDHPNAVTIHDVGELEGTPFIVMELISGRALRAVVGDVAVPLSQRLRWLRDTALALGRAHELGIVHRDVKPENVMLTEDERIKVLDFGIARQLAGAADPHGLTQSPGLGTLTVEGAVIGTVRYMSPEQIRGSALDGRSDQFSWGVMAYELLTGRLPFEGADAVGYGASVLADAPPPMTDTPGALSDVVLRALQKKPDDRFPSMQKLVSALDGEAGSIPPPEPKAKRAPAPGGPSENLSQYSTAQVSQILKRAVDLQEQRTPGLGFETLVEVAREVGVDRAALDAAARELHGYVPPRRARTRQVRRFNRHLATWGIFAVFFFVLNLLTSSHLWFLYPVMGWGLGVALHALRVYMPEGDDDEARVDPEVARGARVLMNETARRVRVERVERVRVSDDEQSREAEEEDSAEQAQRTVKRARRTR